ncbi:MAG: preprotein translocase subunit SecA [Parvularculales bacterium]
MALLDDFVRRFFSASPERKVKSYLARVDRINALEDEYQALDDAALTARTGDFKQRLAEGASPDDILPEAFATVREAARRTLGQRHYDVQLIGGMALHEGRIAEMKTGEGKTLASTLPVYLNALTGLGVHVVTVNDYLAQRDAEWMGQIYRFLGLEVRCILHEMSDEERRAAYHADITYGTNNELGFDYLRDNMKYQIDDMVQRDHVFAIVDEVDSILIDEARTPLIISGPVEGQQDLYTKTDMIIPDLTPDDYELDEKNRTVSLTEQGTEHAEQLLTDTGLIEGESLYDVENVSVVHHLNQALRAHTLFQKDKDYIVKGDRVVIIDEFTGRMMEGRRYGDGLHQALEAKEKAEIQPENQTLASITFQNYFRLYNKLAGMTGTAATEAEEFMDIYGLDVVEIPTNVNVQRDDQDDEIYRTAKEKYDAILELIRDCHTRKQPILVGTTSIEKSEYLADMLKKAKIRHTVLNARYHEQEAHIIARAGMPGAVTIATNMAGRGTDIQLGGNPDMRIEDETQNAAPEKHDAIIKSIQTDTGRQREQAMEQGGLFVLGTERHESRRIDNQLRGRSGRQGDPGTSRFFLSLDDDLMRIFGSDRLDGMLQKLGLKDGEAVVHPWINKALERAQKKVEARNFDIRKNLLKYDNVMNDQRRAIFDQRLSMMRTDDISDTIVDMRHELVSDMVDGHVPEKAMSEQWDMDGLEQSIIDYFDTLLPVRAWGQEEGIAGEEIKERLTEATDNLMAARVAQIGAPTMRQVEKAVLLQTLDHHWRNHLSALDHLRQVVGLRGYGQRDPLNEYKTEAFSLFEGLLSRLRSDVTRQLARIKISAQTPPPQLEDTPLPAMEAHHINPLTGRDEMSDSTPDVRSMPPPGVPNAGAMPQSAPQSGAPNAGGAAAPPNEPARSTKVPRNAPCPCGSGKKYKHCHGKIA